MLRDAVNWVFCVIILYIRQMFNSFLVLQNRVYISFACLITLTGDDLRGKKLLFTALPDVSWQKHEEFLKLFQNWRIPFFFSIKVPAEGLVPVCLQPLPGSQAEFSGNSSVLPSALPCRNAQSPGIIGWFVDFNQLSVQPDWNGALQGGAWSVQSAQRFCGVQVFARLRVLFTHSYQYLLHLLALGTFWYQHNI